MAARSFCFPPIVTAQSRVLILGSMPGVKSLEEGQYYAHPQNSFWRIMGVLFDMPVTTYAERVDLIKNKNLALWDVMEACIRDGSLDSNINDASIVVNDFPAFFAEYPKIKHVFFNGTKAETTFMKRAHPHLPPARATSLHYHRFPSTSPAMATLSFEEKVRAWRNVVDFI